MPDSFGKRQRNAQKARKFAAREERRAARKKERADRAAGILPEQPPTDPETEAPETGSEDQAASNDTP
jgi:hypothetical protein